MKERRMADACCLLNLTQYKFEGDAERPAVGTLWSGATFRAKVLPVASEVLPKGSSTSASAAPETTTAAYVASVCASARRRGGGGGGG